MALPVTLLTTDDLAPMLAALRAMREAQSAAAQPADDYLSVAQGAVATGVSERTVRKWIGEGKPDRKGKIIRLFTLEFSPGFPRVPRSALLAFGQALGFEAAQLTLPPAGAPPPKTTPPKRRVLDSEQALRRAS